MERGSKELKMAYDPSEIHERFIGPVADFLPPWIGKIDEIFEKLTDENQRQYLANEIEYGIQILEYRNKLISKQIENGTMLKEMVKQKR